MLSTENGCVCHLLPAGRQCIACIARQKGSENNRTCSKCGRGLMPGNTAEEATGKCTECQNA